MSVLGCVYTELLHLGASENDRCMHPRDQFEFGEPGPAAELGSCLWDVLLYVGFDIGLFGSFGTHSMFVCGTLTN